MSSYRAPWPPDRDTPPWALRVLGAALLGATCLACTAAQQTTAGIAIGDIAAAGPVVCSILTAADGSSAGQVCGMVAGDVSTVAGLIQGILKSLGASSSAVVAPPVVWAIRTTQVTLRADLAPRVKASALAQAGIK